nr:hypothetical protein [Tanacetum cinerariifolium]
SCSKKVKIAFENADSSSRVELIPSKIKYSIKVVLGFHNEFSDLGENSSQSPPQIDHQCCYGCGDSLDGIFCQRCTCMSCGKDAHYGYNCPPKKIPICYNNDDDEESSTPLRDIIIYELPPIDKADCDPEEENCLIEKLLDDNSSPCPPEESNSKNSDAVIKYFSPSPVPIEDSDSLMEEIDLSFTPDDSMPSGIENDDMTLKGIYLSLKNCLAMIPFTS